MDTRDLDLSPFDDTLIIQTQQESSHFEANAITDERVQNVLQATLKTISSFFRSRTLRGNGR